MTRDEQKAITEFVQRAVSLGQPPVDVEADAIIRALFVRNPEAAYRVTKLAMALERSQYPAVNEITASPRRRWFFGLFARRRGGPTELKLSLCDH